ncbi:hypothetical protein CAPTEDRAFT_191575 [Capitella teleta]|uniref:Uncharacterized protein n=1 Tax=Capitella teleta TaxID=283909 RepID=R7V6K8_CAPTE|nr:hypothetical protein CAPTEDRAFT_191575 [Capitella teleta]|eukprot:ELU14097.1 hypothetical protein CAPTEDRAFT_191575 [Capitella teleta]
MKIIQKVSLDSQYTELTDPGCHSHNCGKCSKSAQVDCQHSETSERERAPLPPPLKKPQLAAPETAAEDIPCDHPTPGPAPLTAEKKAVNRQRVSVSRLKKKLAKMNADAILQKDVLVALDKFLGGPSLPFVKMQIRINGRKRKGHRWSDNMKALALALYHHSPKCLRLLQKLFRLSSTSTLKRIMKAINIEPGLN